MAGPKHGGWGGGGGGGELLDAAIALSPPG